MCSIEEANKGPHTAWVHSYEMSQIGKAIETESRLVCLWGENGTIQKWLLIGAGLLWGDENVLKWIVVKLHIFSEMQKPIEMYLTRWISWYMNSISKLERAYLRAGRVPLRPSNRLTAVIIPLCCFNKWTCKWDQSVLPEQQQSYQQHLISGCVYKATN